MSQQSILAQWFWDYFVSRVARKSWKTLVLTMNVAKVIQEWDILIIYLVIWIELNTYFNINRVDEKSWIHHKYYWRDSESFNTILRIFFFCCQVSVRRDQREKPPRNIWRSFPFPFLSVCRTRFTFLHLLLPFVGPLSQFWIREK
jgi:hypothetical protein